MVALQKKKRKKNSTLLGKGEIYSISENLLNNSKKKTMRV